MASSAVELAGLFSTETSYIPWRHANQGWLCAPAWSRGRREGAWLAVIAFFLVLSGVVPLTFVMMSMLSVLAVATCLRAYALHEYARQLTELAEQHSSAGSVDDDTESSASGSAVGATGGASTPARRRPRRPSLFATVAAARPLSLLNLRLSLMDRDFTESDFDLLVRLDELEAASRQDPVPPPLPESQLALLPVHVHRTPTKKCGKAKQSPFLPATPRKPGGHPVAPAGQGQLPTTPGSQAEPPGTPAGQARAPRVLRIPVLVEPPPLAASQQQQQQQQQQQLGTLPLQQLQVQQVPRQYNASQPLQDLSGRTSPPASRLGRCCPPTATARACDGGLDPQAGCPGAGQQQQQQQQQLGTGLAGAAGAAGLQSTTSESEVDDDVPLCSICLDPFEDGMKILSLPCRHEYHVDCVTQWLRVKGMDSTCPNCKGNVFHPEGAAGQAAPAMAAAR